MTWNSFVIILFGVALFMIVLFVIWCARAEKLHFLHKLYLALGLCYAEWVIPLIIMQLAGEENQQLLFILDCFTSIGGLAACVLYLMIAVAFVKGLNSMPRWFWSLLIIPAIAVVVTFTNPVHHLQYVHFSIHRKDIIFGPFILVTGGYSYICLVVAVVILLTFGLRNNNLLYLKQCLLMATGGIIPLAVNAVATFTHAGLPITATPAVFIVTIAVNGIAIYQLHLLDMKPIAIQQVLDGISDCYMIVSDTGLVISYNRPFEQIFGKEFGIQRNQFLKECIRKEDVVGQTAVYNMLTAIEQTCREEMTVTYEQNMSMQYGDVVKMRSYMTTVSPVLLHGEYAGVVLVFKDMTQLKESMQQLQTSRERMMEQESLVFLGQMIGGIAHNLKTPIMGVSGCIVSAEALIEECEESLDDPDVNEEDYREIYRELSGWLDKMKDSVSYMSDIITTIKDQATNVSVNEDGVFAVEEAVKRCVLLIRHEMIKSSCKVKTDYDKSQNIYIKGDLTSLVQVLVNLLSNAAYSQKQKGGGEIVLKIRHDSENIYLMVIDHGTGVSDKVKGKLFRSMVTTKGAQGTGIGLYISNTVIKGKFDGSMWNRPNAEGGETFGVTIPMKRVIIQQEHLQ